MNSPEMINSDAVDAENAPDQTLVHPVADDSSFGCRRNPTGSRFLMTLAGEPRRPGAVVPYVPGLVIVNVGRRLHEVNKT